MRHALFILTIILTVICTRAYYGIGTPQNTCGLNHYISFIEEENEEIKVFNQGLADQIELLNNILKNDN